MVAMSGQNVNSNGSDGAGSDGEDAVEDVDFEGLASDVLSAFGKLKLLKSSSGWSAIALPMMVMPGEAVDKTVGAMFSQGGSPDAVQKSLDLLRLAVLESTETEGGAKLGDLAFGEWIELLEQWANG